MVNRGALAAIRVAVAVLVAGAGLAGCADSGEDRPDDRAGERAEESRQPEEEAVPPVFAAEPAFTIPTGPGDYPPVVLHERSAFAADEGGVSLYSMTGEGEEVARAETENPPLYEPWDPDAAGGDPAELEEAGAMRPAIHQPLVTEIDGTPTVLSAHAVERDNRAGRAIELIALDAATGQDLWHAAFEPSEWPEGQVTAAVRSVHRGTAAVQLYEDETLRGTYGVEVASGRLAWEEPDFGVMAWHEDGLAGLRFGEETSSLIGIGLSDGAERWSEPLASNDLRVQTVGPYLKVEVEGDGQGPRLVDVLTGDTVHTSRDGLTSEMGCWQEPAGTTVVCAGLREGAVAWDKATGVELWRRPPDGPGSWHGQITAAYGELDLLYYLRNGTPRMMDARTGEDVNGDPGVAPEQLTPYAAMVGTDSGADIYLAGSR